MSGKLDKKLLESSAEAHLAKFRSLITQDDPDGITVPTSRAVLSDPDLESQMRNLQGIWLQRAFIKAGDAKVGTCVAAGFTSNDQYRLRIFRKAGANQWTQHTFEVEVNSVRVGGGRGKIGKRQPVYTWTRRAPQPSGQFPLPTVMVPRPNPHRTQTV